MLIWAGHQPRPGVYLRCCETIVDELERPGLPGLPTQSRGFSVDLSGDVNLTFIGVKDPFLKIPPLSTFPWPRTARLGREPRA